MSETIGHGVNPRMDRIEAQLEVIVQVQRDMQQEHKMLLRAQVVQGDEIQQLSKRTDERFQALAEAQQRMDNALTVLVGTVDLIIRSKN